MGKYKSPSHQVEWIDADVRTLLSLAGKISKEEIAVILKTSVERVVGKASTQGIKLRVIK